MPLPCEAASSGNKWLLIELPQNAYASKKPCTLKVARLYCTAVRLNKVPGWAAFFALASYFALGIHSVVHYLERILFEIQIASLSV